MDLGQSLDSQFTTSLLIPAGRLWKLRTKASTWQAVRQFQEKTLHPSATNHTMSIRVNQVLDSEEYIDVQSTASSIKKDM